MITYSAVPCTALSVMVLLSVYLTVSNWFTMSLTVPVMC